MQFIAVNWHIYRLLENEVLAFSLLGCEFELGAQALGLGVLGLVRVLPVILFGLVGGVLADMHDRRKLIIWTQAAAALFTALLAALTLYSLEIFPMESPSQTPAREAVRISLARGSDVGGTNRHDVLHGRAPTGGA